MMMARMNIATKQHKRVGVVTLVHRFDSSSVTYVFLFKNTHHWVEQPKDSSFSILVHGKIVLALGLLR